MKSWLVQLWVLAAALNLAVGAGCSVERAEGEYGVGVCSDHADNDADGEADCRDPDCQAEDVCGRASPLKEPDGAAARPLDAGLPALPPAVPPPLDAGSEPPAQPAPDAQVSEPPTSPDPGVPAPTEEPDPLVCEPACSSNETCIERYCVPNEAVFVEIWNVVAVSVRMPRTDSAGHCLDSNFACVPMFSDWFTTCDCPPDPMVRVAVRRPGEEPELGFETDSALQTDAHEWKVSKQLLLRSEFEIVLTAFDSDGLVATPVFSCAVLAEPELLGTGTVSCTKTFEVPLRDPFVAKISISVRPASGTSP